MSLVEQLGPHLPYLRRYARALTGDQRSGDQYVKASLQALAAGEAELEALPPRVALYKLFQAIWGQTGAKLEAAPPSGNAIGERVLRIPPRHRQAFLLTALEGFTIDEVRLILDESQEGVRSLITQAQGDIERELATSVLIIEDEPVIAADIEALVRDLGHRITAIATTRSEAVAAVKAHRPGLVLADIQLADGSSGVDAVNDILKGHDIPVIFITAFPERLLTGEKPEPAFLITKPFQPETVKAAIGQALFFHVERPVAA
ncbi:MAG: response regulator [Alphaproteobacteria bacterium]|nr:response regulator [Alphaproteobacteria bacterium]